MKRLIVIPLCTLAFVLCHTIVLAQNNSFVIQVASLTTEANAETLVNSLQAEGFEAYLSPIDIPGKGLYFRIRIGFFASKAAAQKQAEQALNRQLINDYMIVADKAPKGWRPAQQKINAATKAVATLQQSQKLAVFRGQVTDEAGDAILGATITLVDSNNRGKNTTTNAEGRYVFSDLVPGIYRLRVAAPGFTNYERASVEVLPERREELNIKLSVVLKDEVTVGSEPSLNTDPDSNAGALVLRGSDLNALPDNPESLAVFLQALAGTSTGLSGGQIVVDGFAGNRIPPKESIREIRINRNPFSAEFDRPGSSRIEVTTKPGTNKFQGGLFFNFNDESLNTRNPFTPVRAPFQSRFYGGNVSGPLMGKRASYFVNLSRYETDNNAVINAIVLDPALNIARFNRAVLTPQRNTIFSPRIDYQLNNQHTLVGRYTFSRSSLENGGVGEFSLQSRAFNTSNVNHTVQLTETAVLSKQLINETRFQYIRERRRQVGDSSVATLRVLDAFTGGGSQVGSSFANEDRFALYNYTTWALGKQTLKFGGRLRGVDIKNTSFANFGGTYTFAGGLAPQLGTNNEVVRDANGQIVMAPITSIERYRRTLLFQSLGLTPAEIRTQGGGATQFSIAGGKPAASVGQMDMDAFLQTDWRVRPTLTISVGVRYDRQTNISSNLNFAPRMAFAWSPKIGKTGQPIMVIRGGVGIFYDRFSEGLTLQANRFNGVNQRQFVVTNPDILDLYPSVPSVATLAAFAVPQTVRRLDDALRSPYTVQSTIGVEGQMPSNVTLSISFTNTRTLHALRSRNINAPLPGTFVPGVRNSGVRPYGNVGNIFEFESSGVLDQRQLAISANNRLSNNLSLFASYILNKANGDSDGAGSFPANAYDLSKEYGRSALDIRHQFYLGGSVGLPYGISLSPLIVVHSGIPFNITTGRDTNGDTIFAERPAFATDLNKSGVIVTRFGSFDPNPEPTQEVIPRNYGQGSGFVTVNLYLSRTFSFGNAPGRKTTLVSLDPDAIDPVDIGVRALERNYKVTVSIQVQNLFNRTNLGIPIGNLSSPFFGQSLSTAGDSGFGGSNPAGNRRIEMQIRINF